MPWADTRQTGINMLH